MKRSIMVCIVLLLMSGIASATPVVNGGFDSGLSGWDVTDGVTLDGAAARLQIQPYELNITTITLLQALTITSPAILSFDVLFNNGTLRTLPDGVDAGQPSYFQASFLPEDASLNQLYLMGYDVGGPYAMDLNPLPGTISTNGMYHFEGVLAGNGTLYLELYDRGDAAFSTAWIDNVVLTEISSPDPVPEPSTMLLFGAGIAGLVFIRRRQV